MYLGVLEKTCPLSTTQFEKLFAASTNGRLQDVGWLDEDIGY